MDRRGCVVNGPDYAKRLVRLIDSGMNTCSLEFCGEEPCRSLFAITDAGDTVSLGIEGAGLGEHAEPYIVGLLTEWLHIRAVWIEPGVPEDDSARPTHYTVMTHWYDEEGVALGAIDRTELDTLLDALISACEAEMGIGDD